MVNSKGDGNVNEIDFILHLTEKVLSGGDVDRDEAQLLGEVSDENILFFMAAADRIRRRFDGGKVDLCAIVNARSGRCSEDCKYCAQSKYHHTDAAVYPLIETGEILKKAREARRYGANRFAIVTSGKGMAGDREFDKVLAAVRALRQETDLKICCSLGALNEQEALALKEAGVARYHHNIETSRHHYGNICTTHTYEDRIKTIKVAQRCGLEICSGGILGMEETMRDRIDMALALRDLQVDSIPLNILHPVPGTVFAGKEKMNPWEILKSFAVFKFVVPKCRIRTAGGREINLRQLQANALLAGLSGMMIGGYLTTGGRSYADDRRMLADLAREAERC